MSTVSSATPTPSIIQTTSNDELADFFAEVLPNYDRDRVYMSHVRKLIQWYNILIGNDFTEFSPEKAENEALAEGE